MISVIICFMSAGNWPLSMSLKCRFCVINHEHFVILWKILAYLTITKTIALKQIPRCSAVDGDHSQRVCPSLCRTPQSWALSYKPDGRCAWMQMLSVRPLSHLYSHWKEGWWQGRKHSGCNGWRSSWPMHRSTSKLRESKCGFDKSLPDVSLSLFWAQDYIGQQFFQRLTINGHRDFQRYWFNQTSSRIFSQCRYALNHSNPKES